MNHSTADSGIPFRVKASETRYNSDDGEGGWCYYSSPFSVEFDFSSGITSGALFDGADSQLPDLTLPSSFAEGLGFIGTPTYGAGKIVPVVACADVEGNQATDAVSSCSFAAVPEPPDLGILAAALMMLAMIHQFRIGRTTKRPAEG